MGSNNELIKQIERLRSEMVNTVKEYGYSSEQSVKISQKLDLLLNKYNKKRGK